MDNKDKLIFCSDVDGTLIPNSRLYLGEDNLEAINNVINHDDFFIFASGRTYKSLRDLIKYNDSKNLIYICENGNIVFYDNEILYKNSFSKDFIYSFLTYLYNNYLPFMSILISTPFISYFIEYNGDLYIDLEERVSEKNVNLERIFKLLKDKDVIKISLYRKVLDNEFKRIYNELSINFKDKLEVFDANNNWIDISPLYGNKGNALKFIMNKFNFNYDNLYVFGDGENDISMLTLTKKSYAPSGALAKVKEIANYKFNCLAQLLISFYLNKK